MCNITRNTIFAIVNVHVFSYRYSLCQIQARRVADGFGAALPGTDLNFFRSRERSALVSQIIDQAEALRQQAIGLLKTERQTIDQKLAVLGSRRNRSPCQERQSMRRLFFAGSQCPHLPE